MDKYESFGRNILEPPDDAFAITPSDTQDLAVVPRAIYVGTGGDLAVVTAAGTTVTFRNVQAGALIVQRVGRVLATGTTAADLVGQP